TTKPRGAFFTQTDQNGQNPQQVVPPRLNATAILLPNGQVFVSGGMNQYLQNPPSGKTYDQAFGVFVPEIYDPPTDTWTALTDTPATVGRGYHSNALLMLDGRVLTAGSEINNVFGAASAEYRMELFEPDYIAATNRMTITAAPPCVAYGETFEVDFQVAAGGSSTVSRVAIMRFGSATHGFDYDQRYVGLTFTQSAGKLNAVGPPSGGVAPPGYYMLWLIDNGGLPCVQARTIRVGSQRVYVETDRSVFSIYDVQFNEDPATHVASYSRAVALVFDGFIPNEILSLTATGTVTGGNGVHVTFSAALPGEPNPAMELANSPQLIQRTVFAFDVVFDDVNAAFMGLSTPDGIRTLTIKLMAGAWSATATIDLVTEPSPFMIDGQPFYLSQDIRVFQVTEATAANWLPNHAWAGPTDYIQNLIAYLNAPTDNGEAMFAQLPPGEQASALSLLPTADGTTNGPKIYSFALARVRLDSASVPANQTRVLFRLFRCMRPSLVYNTSTIYRRAPTAGTDVVGLLGVEGPDLISIPFFASDRVTPTHDMTSQPDPANLIDLPNGPSEQVRFFGCWLDINQPDLKHFPASPGMATDFSMVNAADLRSIQALIGSFHQCVVAEVHYKMDAMSPDLPHQGDSPSTSDKLAQRNLSLLNAPNPGNAATRTVWQSFEIKGPGTDPIRFAAAKNKEAVRENFGIDALVLWWGNLPQGAVADLYLPGVRAREVLALTPPVHAPVWRILDDHTLRCVAPGHVAFLPLPRAIRDRALSGLLTLRLPRGIRHGQTFRCVGQHYTRAGRIVGAFQVGVQVSADHDSLIVDDKDQLAILKYNFSLMHPADRWRPIQQRIIDLLEERLEGFDVDPGSVRPSPWGAGPHQLVIGGPSGKAGGDDRDDAVIFKGELILPAGTELDIAIDARIRLRAKDSD
ncbi:MAG TPA: galactose oxidase-like domain-containing protein, partial [Bradyrhizobium sp.]|nr:galactose oxidase-like domain-containing protein [Bradyrhizobium sp.]